MSFQKQFVSVVDRLVFAPKKIYLVLAVLFCLNAPFAYSNPPKWYIQNDYNKDWYLVGLGEAATLEDAKSQAFADIGRVFGVSVKQNAQKRYISHTTEKSVSISSQFQNDVSLASEHNLVNVKIEKQERGKKSKKYYVLAVMDKSETAALLEKTIIDNERTIGSYLTQVEREPDYIKKVLLANKALEISKKNDVFVQQMFVLDYTRAGNIKIAEPYQYQSLLSYIQEIDSKIKFRVSNQHSIIANSIKDMLSDVDIAVSSSGAVYLFETEFDIKRGSEQYGSYFLDYAFYIKVRNTETGREIKRFSFAGREMGYDEANAIENAMTKLNKEVQENLEGEFVEYLNSLLD